MWTREELKKRGKAAFQRNYWKCVLVSLILMLLVGGGASSGGSQSNTNMGSINSAMGGLDYSADDLDILYDEDFDDDTLDYNTIGNYVSMADNAFLNGLPVSALFQLIGGGIILVVMIAVLLLQIFVFNLFEVGCCSYYINNASEPAGLGHLTAAFKDGQYGKMVLTLFLRKLYTILWSFLLIVPGIVKTYEYYMVPYLLADDSTMSRADAFRISKEMMQGEKWRAFVLSLSFILWEILSAVTLGIAGVFYVNPYVDATKAELYLELKRKYFDDRRYAFID